MKLVFLSQRRGTCRVSNIIIDYLKKVCASWPNFIFLGSIVSVLDWFLDRVGVEKLLSCRSVSFCFVVDIVKCLLLLVWVLEILIGHVPSGSFLQGLVNQHQVPFAFKDMGMMAIHVNLLNHYLQKKLVLSFSFLRGILS